MRIESLQSVGGYRSSVLRPTFARNSSTLVALELAILIHDMTAAPVVFVAVWGAVTAVFLVRG